MNNQAELISIGNELLSGQTLNLHGQTLGGALAAIGLQLIRDTTIPDEHSIIGSTIQEALTRTDLVFVSGGLGPTPDDITREALAKILKLNIVLDSTTVAIITKRYAARGRKMTPAAERQALVLEGATVLPNSAGAAPGQRIEQPNNKNLFILPGPPNEFKAILNEEIIPWLRSHYIDAKPKLIRMVQTQGIGESDIVTLLEDAKFNPKNIDLGFYPAQGKVKIRLSADPSHEAQISAAEQTLIKLFAAFIHLD